MLVWTGAAVACTGTPSDLEEGTSRSAIVGFGSGSGSGTFGDAGAGGDAGMFGDAGGGSGSGDAGMAPGDAGSGSGSGDAGTVPGDAGSGSGSGDAGAGGGPGCGNFTCDVGLDETCASCPVDCGTCSSNCGDGICSGVGYGETCSTCAADCSACTPTCGDGSCNSDETHATCAGDCPATCGDGVCLGGESCLTCVQDCGGCSSTCGDHVCADDESYLSCSADCGPSCGDGICDPYETSESCDRDCARPVWVGCGIEAFCSGDGECQGSPPDCGAWSGCGDEAMCLAGEGACWYPAPACGDWLGCGASAVCTGPSGSSGASGVCAAPAPMCGEWSGCGVDAVCTGSGVCIGPAPACGTWSCSAGVPMCSAGPGRCTDVPAPPSQQSFPSCAAGATDVCDIAIPPNATAPALTLCHPSTLDPAQCPSTDRVEYLDTTAFVTLARSEPRSQPCPDVKYFCGDVDMGSQPVDCPVANTQFQLFAAPPRAEKYEKASWTIEYSTTATSKIAGWDAQLLIGYSGGKGWKMDLLAGVKYATQNSVATTGKFSGMLEGYVPEAAPGQVAVLVKPDGTIHERARQMTYKFTGATGEETETSWSTAAVGKVKFSVTEWVPLNTVEGTGSKILAGRKASTKAFAGTGMDQTYKDAPIPRPGQQIVAFTNQVKAMLDKRATAAYKAYLASTKFVALYGTGTPGDILCAYGMKGYYVRETAKVKRGLRWWENGTTRNFPNYWNDWTTTELTRGETGYKAPIEVRRVFYVLASEKTGINLTWRAPRVAGNYCPSRDSRLKSATSTRSPAGDTSPEASLASTLEPSFPTVSTPDPWPDPKTTAVGTTASRIRMSSRMWGGNDEISNVSEQRCYDTNNYTADGPWNGCKILPP
jgi:hypothetical protein